MKYFKIVFFFTFVVISTNSCGQSNENLDSTINILKDKLKPYKDITDSVYVDIDCDGLTDIVYLTQTDDTKYRIPKNDKKYRDEIVIFLSSTREIQYLNNILPCFNCGYVVLGKENTYDIKIKKTPFYFYFVEIQNQIPINSYYIFEYDKKMKKIYLIRKLRVIEGDTCKFREEVFRDSQKIKIEEVDTMNDFFNEQLWYYSKKDKSCSILKNIRISKTIINSTPNISTKMYLVKGDEVEILEEKDNWLKIRYYGNKTIEGWIKKSDVE